MLYQVAVLLPNGEFEILARNISAERAESIARHPSLSGSRVIVVSMLTDLVTI